MRNLAIEIKSEDARVIATSITQLEEKAGMLLFLRVPGSDAAAILPLRYSSGELAGELTGISMLYLELPE